MTKYKIAKELGITPQAVQSWYSGKSSPTMKNMVRLAKLLDKTHEEILKEFKVVDKTSK